MMPFSSRPAPARDRRARGRRWAALAAAVTATAALPTLALLAPAQAAVTGPAVFGPAVTGPAGPAGPAVSAPAAKAGLTGSKITVVNNTEFSGYDLATGPDGTSYLGWIGDSGSGRKVSLCTLPRGATRCAGGIQTIAAATNTTFSSTAAGLQVLVSPSNLVTLIWEHATVNSENGSEGDEIAIATSQGGGTLTQDQDVSPAPSFGVFLGAAISPDGGIWAITNPASASHKLQITRGLGNPHQTITAPYYPGRAQIVFHDGSAVIAISKYGAITAPISYTRQSGGGWTGFKSIAKTWNVAGFGMAGTTSGVALITSASNSGYHPVVTRLSHGSWSTPRLTGDVSSCSSGGHDVVTDSSGRLADVTDACDSKITVSNLPNTQHAALFRFSLSNTEAGGTPQLTTAPSGRGWVAWSVESARGDKLFASPLVLPGLDHSSTATGAHGRVTVTGPTSCLPPVDIAVGVVGHPASGWHVASRSLRLDGSSVGGVLHGAGLTPGRSFTLTGTVTFAKGGSTSTTREPLGFRTCPQP